jgi:diguanylate cyclase (GGDEF)-like protein
MKISDVSKAQHAGRVAKAEKTSAPAAPKPAAPVDAVVIAGIPDNELTPRVRAALTSLMEEVQALRAELAATRTRIGELEQLADADPLVGVLNRRAFVRELNRALAMTERYGTPSCLLFADLNELKLINDSLGHAAGDAALAHVAKVLSAHIRQTDAIGRLGGDEFGVILTQTDYKTAAEKAAALAGLVAVERVAWNGEPFAARISCGVVEIKRGLSADEALATADSAMYEAKKKR